jgi:hypothetical protein
MAIITANGKKFIEKRDSSFELYNLANDMAEAHELSSQLPKDGRIFWKELITELKKDTGYDEAADKVRQLYQSGAQQLDLNNYF